MMSKGKEIANHLDQIYTDMLTNLIQKQGSKRKES
jgi:flagellin-specific chaperone FliS